MNYEKLGASIVASSRMRREDAKLILCQKLADELINHVETEEIALGNGSVEFIVTIKILK